jgi:hypothetical protein
MVDVFPVVLQSPWAAIAIYGQRISLRPPVNARVSVRWSIILASLVFVTRFHVSCFLVGGGPPHAQPKISKTTPCKVAKRLLALDSFGDPAKAFDTSGKSAAPLHHRAFVAHAGTAFDPAMHMARAQATATDAKRKSESWQQSYAALRFSMTCRKFVANSP